MNGPDNSFIEEKVSLEQLKALLAEKNLEIAQLKQKNSLLKKICDNLPGRLFCKNTEGIYLFSNRDNTKCIQISAREEAKTLEDFQGKTDVDIFPTEMAKMFREGDLEVICARKSTVREYTYPNERGLHTTESVNKIPLYDDQGRIIAVMGYCFDITYLKSLETKVKNAGVAKIEFIRHMQHDTKTPFTGIIGLTNLLLKDETDSEKKSFLEAIISCTNELLEYCDRILDFSKAAVKNLPLVPLTFQLRDIVDSVINMSTPVAKIKRLHLFMDYAESLPKTVIGYPHRLKSILVNLLNNALQYTQQGQIHLIVQPKALTKTNPLIIQFIIKDTGQGMSSEKQLAIQKQLNNTPTIENDTYEGKGLGLRIISQFSKDMGAKVSVRSQLGRGTIFTVETPLASQKP